MHTYQYLTANDEIALVRVLFRKAYVLFRWEKLQLNVSHQFHRLFFSVLLTIPRFVEEIELHYHFLKVLVISRHPHTCIVFVKSLLQPPYFRSPLFKNIVLKQIQGSLSNFNTHDDVKADVFSELHVHFFVKVNLLMEF